MSNLNLPAIAYSCDKEMYSNDDPESIAEEYLECNGGSSVIVYSGTPYIPSEGTSEHDFMEGEGFCYLIKDVKKYGHYINGKLEVFQ